MIGANECDTPFFRFAHYSHFAEPCPPAAGFQYFERAEGDELEDAAEALRAAELDAVRANDASSQAQVKPEAHSLSAAELEAMSIDEVRTIAKALDIPERGKIVEKSELIDEIMRRQ